MYLILGTNLDPCSSMVASALEARGLTVRVVDCPFNGAARLSWSLADQSESRLVLNDSDDDGDPVTGDQLDGVLVRSAGLISGNGWQAEDHDYMRCETQAALLGWLWSLSCPVVGRLPASTWYRPLEPITFWQSLLGSCGLAAPEALVTNVAHESRAFGERLGGGVICAPFSTAARYAVATEDEWNGLLALQERAPVCLAQPYGPKHQVCLVGQRVTWEGRPPAGGAELESGLGRFAASAGLSLVEFAVAYANDCLRIVDVNPRPRFEHFGDAARQAIVANIVELLTGGAANSASRMSSIGAS